jgi:hypothetical protein
MKNHILIKRCLIGVLAYFLCALANAAIFKDNETGALTGDPLGFTLSYAASVGYGSGASDITDPCSSVPVGGGCRISLWAKSSTSGVRIARSFTRIKEDLCQPKKNQSAGIYNIPIPGVKMPSTGGAAVLFDSGSFNSFSKAGFPTCIESCATVASGPPIKNSLGGNVVGDTAGNAFMRMYMKFTGSECTAKENAPKPNGAPFPTDAPKPNEPKGPQDCPAGTSFGTISWGDGTGEVKRCVKTGAPLPPNPDGSPKPDACIGNCDNWDPKPTDPKDPNKPTNPNDGTGGTGSTGTGTNTGTGTGNASGPANASGVASGASTMGINDVVSDDLYKTIRTDKTPGPFEGYLNTLDPEKYPLFKQIKNFFKGVPSGSCPVWTIPSVRIFNHSLPSYNIDVFCSPVMMSSVYPVMKGVVLFVSSFFAFRWAIL